MFISYYLSGNHINDKRLSSLYLILFYSKNMHNIDEMICRSHPVSDYFYKSVILYCNQIVCFCIVFIDVLISI